jgi:hypothetical protein
LWDLAKKVQLTPEKLWNGVLLSKGELDKTAWHIAAYYGHVEVIEKLWNLAKELELTPED